MTSQGLNGECVQPACAAPGVIGLNGDWLCLDHYDAKLKKMRAALPFVVGVVGETPEAAEAEAARQLHMRTLREQAS